MPYKLTAVDGRYEIVSARRKVAALRMRLCGQDAGVHDRAGADPSSRLSHRTSSAVMPMKANFGVPGFFQVDLAEQRTATLIGSTEPWDIIDVLSPAEVLASERERRARLLEEALPEARAGRRARNWFSRATNLSSRRPAAPRKPRERMPRAMKFAP